jgi:small GTP-binding protein
MRESRRRLRGAPTRVRGAPIPMRGAPSRARGSPTRARRCPTRVRGSSSRGRGSPTRTRGSPNPGAWIAEPSAWIAEPGARIAGRDAWGAEPDVWVAHPGAWVAHPGAWVAHPGAWVAQSDATVPPARRLPLPLDLRDRPVVALPSTTPAASRRSPPRKARCSGRSRSTSNSFDIRSLETLGLGDLGLTEVPNWVRGLQSLTELRLHNNHLHALPIWISQLRKLSVLGLRNNDLRALPVSLRELPRLEQLSIEGNIALDLPAEIVGGASARKILDYYFRTLRPGARSSLNEFKLILVGRGGVGKTTLVHRLTTDVYGQFERTPGINITKWPVNVNAQVVRANVWDFGGQEIMHGTHRFFMTERALYIVLISGREGTEDHDAEYWLSLVRSFAGDVPIIVLLNKWDDYRFELNRALLRDKYGKDLVFIEADSSTGHSIEELRRQICRLAGKLQGLQAAWPAEWWRIKDELPAERKDWLTFEDFRLFCAERGVAEPKDQDALAESLHDLGMMLSYRRDEGLREFGVLNPQWVTRGVYAMLNSAALRDAGGKFTVRSFGDALPQDAYPQKLHMYLLALMRRFKLCHPLDDRSERHIIPELLTKEEPKLEKEFPSDSCLGFIYKYGSVLPEGLLPRFIRICSLFLLAIRTRTWFSSINSVERSCRTSGRAR